MLHVYLCTYSRKMAVVYLYNFQQRINENKVEKVSQWKRQIYVEFIVLFGNRSKGFGTSSNTLMVPLLKVIYNLSCKINKLHCTLYIIIDR